MTDVCGLDLNTAIELLRKAGYSAVCTEVRSKKGVVDGNDNRVIRIKKAEMSNTVHVAYSAFKTSV